MIPSLDPVSGNLPPGDHDATWDELETRYGWNEHRRQLLSGMRDAVRALAECGCTRAWIDGSFVTDKDLPGDLDACWEHSGVDLRRLQSRHPFLLDFSLGRARQKVFYRGELFLAHVPADIAGTVFLEFFQTDKRTGESKGIVVIGPRSAT
jgi:hypothetical protein